MCPLWIVVEVPSEVFHKLANSPGPGLGLLDLHQGGLLTAKKTNLKGPDLPV